MGIWTAAVNALAYGLRWAADCFDAENSAEIVASVKAKRLQALKDKLADDVASGNLDKVRDDLAG
jgi:hypothetical protein